jgi:hypothetical protein
MPSNAFRFVSGAKEAMIDSRESQKVKRPKLRLSEG